MPHSSPVIYPTLHELQMAIYNANSLDEICELVRKLSQVQPTDEDYEFRVVISEILYEKYNSNPDATDEGRSHLKQKLGLRVEEIDVPEAPEEVEYELGEFTMCEKCRQDSHCIRVL